MLTVIVPLCRNAASMELTMRLRPATLTTIQRTAARNVAGSVRWARPSSQAASIPASTSVPATS